MAKATEKAKCWRAFSEYVRLRDTHPSGRGSCISCSRPLVNPDPEGNLHAGHFYARSVTFANLYFDEKNVNSQCSHCNVYLQSNGPGYAEGLVRKYGEGILEELSAKKNVLVKLYPHDYKEMAKEYRAKSREMKKQRNIT